MMIGESFITGCDGSFCVNPEEEIAFTLDDMCDIAFCKTCWTYEMPRRKREGGQLIPFPGANDEVRNTHVFHLKYPGFDGAASFEKIRRSTKLEE